MLVGLLRFEFLNSTFGASRMISRAAWIMTRFKAIPARGHRILAPCAHSFPAPCGKSCSAAHNPHEHRATDTEHSHNEHVRGRSATQRSSKALALFALLGGVLIAPAVALAAGTVQWTAQISGNDLIFPRLGPFSTQAQAAQALAAATLWIPS